MATGVATPERTGGAGLILASASPRRRELLAQVCAAFEVTVSPFDEPVSKPPGTSAEDWAASLAYFKARAVSQNRPGEWVLGADTIVACGGEILGKPRDATDARRMLVMQAGRASDVITGVCLLRMSAHEVERRGGAVVTRVWMRNAPDLIDEYIATGDWEGKAGAYGIQNVGDRLVERIEGSFSNVVGLPVETVERLLGAVGVR